MADSMMVPLEAAVSDQAVHAAAEALWNSESHPLLESAGHPILWREQPSSVKNGVLRKARLALSAAANQLAAPTWRPIAEAPRDGRQHVVADDDGEYFGHWDADIGSWFCGDDHIEPVRWFDLPQPPEQEVSGE